MVVTTQSNGNGRRAFQALGGLGVALLIAAACAGTDTPPRTRSLEEAVIERYEPTYATGNAGSTSMAGSGGGGQGGSASTNAGSGGGGGASGGAGSGSGMAGSGSTGNACDAPGTVLIAKCGSVGCHGSGSGFGDFGASAAAAEALVDAPAQGSCPDDLLYFDTASPEDSLVLTKLEDSPPCGSPMPLGQDPLPQADIDCIIDWVSQF